MTICETCGNDYDKAFQVVQSGKAHTFDSFECAIHARRRPVRIAASVSSDTVLKRKAPSSAANTVPKAKASAAYAIGCN